MNIMIDTIKLLIPIYDPMVLRRGAFAPMSIEQIANSRGLARTYLNPSKLYAKQGKYMPRLTLHRRPRGNVVHWQLAVEFSAPKMLFGNNFDELVEDDLEALLTAIQDTLFELLGYKFFKHQLAAAEIGAWHPSKNIVFLNYTSSQTILNTISKLDISRVYDLQKTDFRDGHVVHIHCNSLDIAFYDKMADLRKAKLSDKRALEKDNLIQLNLLDELEEYRPLEVFRYELRFVGRASIKRAYPELEKWTLETMFKKQLCQNILIQHWNKLTRSVDILALDVKQPFELLQNYLEENDDTTPQGALAAVAAMTIISQVGASGLRNTLEARFNKQVWHRLKPSLKSPKAHRFTYFQHIDEALKQFTPTKTTKFLTNIENNSKLW